MKKVAFIFIIIFSIVLLTSCTDTTEELQERIETKEDIRLDYETKSNYSGKDEEPERD